MKRNFAKKAPFAVLILANALFFTSCSSVRLRRGETVDSVQQGANTAPVQMVPREQYDELARKYQELLNQSKQIAKTPAETAGKEIAKNEGQTKPEVGATTTLDPSELINHMDKAVPDTATPDSVDALKPEVKADKTAGPALPTSMGVQTLNATDDVDEQIAKLREAGELIHVNKFDQALTILKDLENSKEKQIVVRAKMMLGDLLFNQGEFDLASQVYEEVIKKYAFSGYVLKALGKLVACSEKLKQPEKQAKYYSLLHDFFEAT